MIIDNITAQITKNTTILIIFLHKNKFHIIIFLKTH